MLLFTSPAFAFPLAQFSPTPDRYYMASESARVRDVGIGDFNGDGVSDVAWVTTGEVGKGKTSNGLGISVCYGGPSGLLGIPHLQFGPTGDWQSLAVADVNGDGFDDLVLGLPGPYGEANPGSVEVYVGSADGVVVKHPLRSDSDLKYHLGQLVVAAGDVDGDGKEDVLVANGDMNEPDWWWFRLGPDDRLVTGEWSTPGTSVVAADFDGDGFTDVASGNIRNNDVLVFSGSAEGPAEVPARVFDRRAPYLVAWDQTADGIDDLGIRVYIPQQNSDLEWYDLTTDSLAPAVTLPTPTNAGLFPIGDLDDDGLQDWAVAIEQEIRLVLGKSPTSVEKKFSFDRSDTFAFADVEVVTGDLTGDGCADLVISAHSRWGSSPYYYYYYYYYYQPDFDEDSVVAVWYCPIGDGEPVVTEPPYTTPIESGDTGTPLPDGETPPGDAPPAGEDKDPDGCGCSAGGSSGWLALGILAVALRGRRR